MCCVDRDSPHAFGPLYEKLDVDNRNDTIEELD